MTRILADLPDEDIKWLDQLAAEQGKSRAAVRREAVEAYRAETTLDWLEAGFGAWKDRTDIGLGRMAKVRTCILDTAVGR